MSTSPKRAAKPTRRAQAPAKPSARPKAEEGTPLGRKILASLHEVLDATKAGGPIEDRLTVREVRLDLAPRPYAGPDVKRVRDQMKLSQAVFAMFLGVSPQTVKAWEQGQREPSDMARRFLEEIEAAPDHWKERLESKFTRRQIGKTLKS
jgi:putative transcriptional regulator